MEDRLRIVIAQNLPTFANCYRGCTEINIPTYHQLLDMADYLIEVIKEEGYQIKPVPIDGRQ